MLEAKELHQADVGGKADPFVQLQTRVQDLEKTVRYAEFCVGVPCFVRKDKSFLLVSHLSI